MHEIIETQLDLNSRIYELEIKQAEEAKLLKEQFYITVEGLRPANLLKSSFKDVATSPFLIDSVLSTAVGLGTGYLTRRIVIGASAGIFKKIFGYLIQIGITNYAATHTESVKSIGQSILKKVTHQNKGDQDPTQKD